MKINIFLWLQKTALSRVWLLLVLISVLLSEAICSLMALLLKGEIPVDYLLTGLVTSGVVAPILVWMVTFFLDHLGHLQANNEHLSAIIAERKQAEIALQESKSLLALTLSSAELATWDWDVTTGRFIFNDRWAELRGYRLEEIEPKIDSWEKGIFAEDLPEVKKSLAEYFDGDSPLYTADYRVCTKTGAWHWVINRGAIIQRDQAGRPLRMIGVEIDITERKQAEKELLIASVAFDSHESMMITDVNCKILRVNKAYTEITGYSSEEVVGRIPSILQSDLHPAEFYAEIKNTASFNGTCQGEVFDRRKNGEIYPTFLTVTAVKTDQGAITHYVAAHIDNSKNKAAAEKIERLAFYDPLTNLPNRRLLLDRLKSALASSHRSGRKGGLLFIDIDNFKTLNDSLGHDMGDLMLQQVAERLNACIRENDTIARLGGDEFVVMLEDLSEHTFEAATLVESIGNKILIVINQPYLLGAYQYYSTPSIGAALFYENEQTIDIVLKQADIAMYQAKALGRNRLCFFDPQMQVSISARVELEADLILATQNNQFILYFQPQVDHNRTIVGAEVLIRWEHPQRGLVSPGYFIPLAEETGLILKIGQWVLESACAQIKAWDSCEHTRHLHLAVNVSARQFQQADFEERLVRVLHNEGVNPNLIKLELTESLVLEDIGNTINKMKKLREIGVKFSMDDFGTGYSSLSSIKKLPLDQLKIDQSFVRDISIDVDDEAIVQTIIIMANKLGMEVIAEGVETEEQLVFLEMHGCKNFQGYLFGKPLPLAEFEQVLKAEKVK
ncbi:MAG: EAL domain-containing protein [Methylomonas sp.]